MMENHLDFALCPHCHEKSVDKFQRIFNSIASILQTKINIVTFKDFIEEEKKLDEFEYHFVYANPDSAVKLSNKGYILLGKLKEDDSFLCSITSLSYSPEKEIINVALINRKYFFLPLLFHRQEYQKFHLIFVENYDEVLKLVKEEAADIGFICTEILEKLRTEDKIRFPEEFCFPAPHFIFIHPSLEKFKDALSSIEGIEKAKFSEIENIKSLYSELDSLLEKWTEHDIKEALLKSPNFGVIIYQEKIVFANDYAIKFLGYTADELYEMSSMELVHKDDRENAIENYKRRLRGENFPAIYEIRYLKKDGSIVWVQCLTETILFKGRYSGLIIFYDITKRKIAENIKNLLKKVNRIITSSLTEEEIYSGICKSLVENFGCLKLVWIGIVDEKGQVIPKFHYGKEDGSFDFIMRNQQYLFNSVKNITIHSDLRENVEGNPVKAELVKRGFLSACAIPILKDNKVTASLIMYSELPNFFTEYIYDLLEEIQHDLSFAIERVETIRHNIIISEALKNSDTWILVTDEKGKIVYVNEAVERISGYKKEELIGKNPRIFKSGLNPPEFYKTMWDTILSGKIFNSITPNRKKDGEIFHVDLKIIPMRLPGNILRFVAVGRDITEKIMLSERINNLQNYDALTGLMNLNGFSAEVSLRLKEASGIMGMFILIDIFDMSYLNKMVGIERGDQILKLFGQKLKEVFQNTDAIARIGADMFGVYLPVASEDIISNYSRVVELNDVKFQIEDKSVSISINAGISIFPKDGKTFRSLYEKADITLAKARSQGPGVIRFFDSEIEKDAENYLNIINLVKRAFERNLFIFYYQPYFYSDSLKLAGFEALVRIVEGEKIYYPNLFINYIENSHYLSNFEDWAISEAVKKIKRWKLNVSINISGRTFNNPEFVKKLSQICEEVRDKITIEVTERIFIEDPERAMEILFMIKKMKNPPKIAMDDFGTGYSSLAYIKDLPIDIIKIDMTFIKNMVHDRKSLAIVQTIIELAKRLDILTLAEGVETKEQLEILRNLGCDMVQGFLFSKPLASETVESDIIKL